MAIHLPTPPPRTEGLPTREAMVEIDKYMYYLYERLTFELQGLERRVAALEKRGS
jgi:hypothetical protein